jgi:hypothetical protein
VIDMVSPIIQFRSTTTLAPLDVKTLVEEGAGLFSRMTLTPEAETYLEYHPKLAEAIKKW